MSSIGPVIATPFNSLVQPSDAADQARRAQFNHVMQEIERIIENYESGNESEEERDRTPSTK